jgi:serine/threonine protein kinase/TPR repeat protein
MKSATFGVTLSFLTLSKKGVKRYLDTSDLSRSSVSRRTHALAAYRTARTNGAPGDHPAHDFPGDGTYSLHKHTDGFYHPRYSEGPGDREWMKQCDRNYLARRYAEKQAMARKQERAAQLCEAQGQLKREQQLKEEAEEQLKHEQQLKALEAARSEAEAARLAALPAQQTQTPATKLSLSEASLTAHQGNADAQFQLGQRYTGGLDVKRDKKEALHWFKKAAAEGHASAQLALGRAYEKGEGTKKSLSSAQKWYAKAAAQQAPHAEKRLAHVKQRIAKRKKSASHHRPTTSSTQSSTSHSSGGREQDSVGSPNHTGLDDSGGMQISLTIPYSRLTFGRKLGNGGFGEVFLGEWRHTEVAIKKLRMKDMSPKILAVFKNEAGIMARLNSPHTVRLYGITLSPEYTLVMEYLRKGSLYDVLSTEKPLPWPTRSQIALDMSIGLAFLHTEGILHQDLKSLNVLLDNHYRAKLADFGLSKIKLESSRTTSTSVQSVGTLSWKAPELFKRGTKYNTACDMYSLGMTLWELSSGKLPFADAQDNEQILAWVLQGEQETIPPETPEHLKVTIQACWALVPTRRPTAAQVVSALKTGGKAMPATAGGSVPAGYQVHSEAQSVDTDPNYPLHTPQAGSSNATGGYSLDSPSLRPPPPIPTTAFSAEVLYPFQGASTEELTLSAGAKVRVVDRVSPEWWRCEHDGQAGLVPSQYLRTLSSAQVPSVSPAGYMDYATPTSGEAVGTAGIFTATTPNSVANQSTPEVSGDYQMSSSQ